MTDLGAAKVRFEIARTKLLGEHLMYVGDDDRTARECGYQDMAAFWQEFLTLTLPRTDLAEILEAVLMSPQQFADESKGHAVPIRSLISQALEKSFRTGEPWWIIPPDVDGRPQERCVRVRDAVNWFLAHPHYRDRIPASLTELVEGSNVPTEGHGSGSRTRRGAKPKADWEAYREAFQDKCKADGTPSLTNVDGWQILADVERWLSALVERDGYSIGESTVRKRANEFMKEAGNY